MYNDTQKNQTTATLTQHREVIPFGEWLIDQGALKQEQIQQALEAQQKDGRRLGEILLRLGFLSDIELTRLLGRFLSIEATDLEELNLIDTEIARKIPENIAKRLELVALNQQDDYILVAMADPLNIVAIDTITVKLKRQIKPIIAPLRKIKQAIEFIYHGSDVDQQRMKDIVDLQVQTEDNTQIEMENAAVGGDTVTEADAQDAPVIRFVDLMLSHAIKSRASDIHIEPQEKNMSIRMRVDGILCDMVPPASKMQPAVIARLKILAEMDIAERRLPQDGRFRIRMGKERSDIDVRVSALPTIYGEKIVLRILDKGAVNHSLDSLGLESEMLVKFRRILELPHGIIVVTGPTGSGKSTTLYSALNELKDPRKNITTVEDPVEYRMAGINQTQVKPEINLDFASCLRSILRQDPDIILIGEIRDKETMEIAIKASMTGHLVLSTFHTNDAPSAVSRFVYMGLEPYLLASSLNLILAQRLVRRVCEKCRKPAVLHPDLMKRLHITPEMLKQGQLVEGVGCSHCNNTGYRGRVPVFEFLVIDPEIRQAIAEGHREGEIRALARKKGCGDLMSSGITRMLAGLTTAEEVLRVTFSDDFDS
jgi:type IV pilus assembly protein PilB